MSHNSHRIPSRYLLQNIHIRGQYKKFDMTIDVMGILAFSLLRNGLKPCIKRSNISPNICPTSMLGEMLDRLKRALFSKTHIAFDLFSHKAL